MRVGGSSKQNKKNKILETPNIEDLTDAVDIPVRDGDQESLETLGQELRFLKRCSNNFVLAKKKGADLGALLGQLSRAEFAAPDRTLIRDLEELLAVQPEEENLVS